MEILNDYEMTDYLDSEMKEDYDPTKKKWVAVDDIGEWLDGYYQKDNVLVRELIRHLKTELKIDA